VVIEYDATDQRRRFHAVVFEDPDSVFLLFELKSMI
jgi:hypothetical protein